MIATLPHLLKFNQSYWHQMGQSVYGSIQDAFNAFLDDVEKLPDNGKQFKTSLKNELIAADSDEYDDWLRCSNNDTKTIRFIQGRFIVRDEILILRRILEDRLT